MSDLISRLLGILDASGYEVTEAVDVADFLDEVAELVGSSVLSDEAVALIGESFQLVSEGCIELVSPEVSEALQGGSVRGMFTKKEIRSLKQQGIPAQKSYLGAEGRAHAKSSRKTLSRMSSSSAMRKTLERILAKQHSTGQTPDEDDVVDPTNKRHGHQYPRAFAPPEIQSQARGGLGEGLNAGQLDRASKKIGNYGTKQNSGKPSKKGATRIVRYAVKRALSKGSHTGLFANSVTTRTH